jgi:hypothetical protein
MSEFTLCRVARSPASFSTNPPGEDERRAPPRAQIVENDTTGARGEAPEVQAPRGEAHRRAM